MQSCYQSHLATLILAVAPISVALGQSSVAVSPFVSYVPSAAKNPLAGFALTFGGTTGLALRAGADMSISNPSSRIDSSLAAPTGGYRPWSADADAMLFLGGLGGGATVFSRALAPYLFSGIGLTGGDSAGVNTVRNGWSYGAGATIPLGLDADLFGEARWRMSQYVLPTARDAPDSKSEFRFGLSFHVGGSSPERRERPPRRRRMDDSYETAVAPAPVVVMPAQAAVPQTVVVTQAPAPPPTVVVVNAPEREPSRTININIGRTGESSRRSRGSDRDRHVAPQSAPVVRATIVVRRAQPAAVQPATTSCTRPATRRGSKIGAVVVCAPPAP